MNGIAASGATDVQARIAEIRSRLAQLSPAPTSASFTLASTSATGGTTTASRTASGRSVPAGASTAASGSAPVRGAADGVTGDTSASRLTQLLPEAGKRWAGPITDAARRHGLDPGLLAALVEKESGFDPAARSHAGAIGLGQLMPGTAAGLGVDPTDPAQNLDGAARYLKQQLDRFGSTDLALAAYNAGPGRVAQAGGVPRITETRNYVDRVLAAWERYR